MRYLTERGTERSLLHEGADPALLLPLPPIARTASLLHEIGISSAKRRLCIVLRDTPKASAHLWRSVVIASRILCRRKNLQPIFLSFCKEDSLAVEAVCMAFDTPMLHVRSVADLAALLRDSHGVLSMRLHPLVLSAASATPAIGLSIDPRDRKMTSFARLSGQELLPYSRPSIAELVALGESVFALPSPQKANLTLQASAEMRKKAWKDLANIVEMIYNKGNGSEKLDPSGLSPSH
jgi:polysaccharide pyruvyl transferase WcaK-like protein